MNQLLIILFPTKTTSVSLFWDGNMAGVTSVVMDSRGAVLNTLTTELTHIVDNSADKGQPHSICEVLFVARYFILWFIGPT